MNIEDLKQHIVNAFQNAEKGISKCSEELLKIDGMTGKRTRHLYNNILNMPDARYLEVGTYSGSSLCAAMFENNLKEVYAVDNWSQFGGPKQIFFENIEKFKGTTNVNFIEADFFSLDLKKLPKFNVYMYDGAHAFEDHVKALTYAMDCLDDIFIYIVDDWHWVNIRNATFHGIELCKLKIHFGLEIKTTPDDSHPKGDLCYDYYWNGVCIFLLEKIK